MTRTEHHVVKEEEGWSVKKEGAAQASFYTQTKAEAVKFGHIICLRQGSELVIHEQLDSARIEKNRK